MSATLSTSQTSSVHTALDREYGFPNQDNELPLEGQQKAIASKTREQFIKELIETMDSTLKTFQMPELIRTYPLSVVRSTIASLLQYSAQDALAYAEAAYEHLGKRSKKERDTVRNAILEGLEYPPPKTCSRIIEILQSQSLPNETIASYYSKIYSLNNLYELGHPGPDISSLSHLDEEILDHINTFYAAQLQHKQFREKESVVTIASPSERQFTKLLRKLSAALDTDTISGTILYSQIAKSILSSRKDSASFEKAVMQRYSHTNEETIEIDGKAEPGSLAARLGSLTKYRTAMLQPTNPFEAIERREIILDIIDLPEEHRGSFRKNKVSRFEAEAIVRRIDSHLHDKTIDATLIDDSIQKTRSERSPFLHIERSLALGKLKNQLSRREKIEEIEEGEQTYHHHIKLPDIGQIKDIVVSKESDIVDILPADRSQNILRYAHSESRLRMYDDRWHSLVMGCNQYRYGQLDPDSFLIINGNSLAMGSGQLEHYDPPAITPKGSVWFLPKRFETGARYHYYDGSSIKSFPLPDVHDSLTTDAKIFDDGSLCILAKCGDLTGYKLSIHPEKEASQALECSKILPIDNLRIANQNSDKTHQLFTLRKENTVIIHQDPSIPERQLEGGHEYSRPLNLDDTPAFIDNFGIIHLFKDNRWIQPFGKERDNWGHRAFSKGKVQAIALNLSDSSSRIYLSKYPDIIFEGSALDFVAIDERFYIIRQMSPESIRIDSCSLYDTTPDLTPYCCFHNLYDPHEEDLCGIDASLEKIADQLFLKVFRNDYSIEYYYTDGTNRRLGERIDMESYYATSHSSLYHLKKEGEEWTLSQYRPENEDLKTSEIKKKIDLLEKLNPTAIEEYLSPVSQNESKNDPERDPSSLKVQRKKISAHPAQAHTISEIVRESPEQIIESGYRGPEQAPSHYRLKSFFETIFPEKKSWWKREKRKRAESYLHKNNQDDPIYSGDPRSRSIRLIQFSEPLFGFAPTGYYAQPDKDGLWSKSNLPVAPPSQDNSNLIEATFTVPPQAEDILLLSPTGARIGTLYDTNSAILHYSIDNQQITSAALSHLEGETVSYTLSHIDEQQSLPELSDTEYETFINQLIEQYGNETMTRIGTLPIEAQRFIQTITSLPITKKIFAIRDWVRLHGYYDMDHSDIPEEERELPITERMMLMSERMDILRQKENTTLHGKFYAGVCADFAILTATMLRHSGVMCEIATGYNLHGKTMSTKNAHAVVACPWRNDAGELTRLYIDSTADNAPIKPLEEERIGSMNSTQDLTEEDPIVNTFVDESFSTLSFRKDHNYGRDPELQKIFDVLMGVPEVYEAFTDSHSGEWQKNFGKWYTPGVGYFANETLRNQESMIEDTLEYNLYLLQDLFSLKSTEAATITREALKIAINLDTRHSEALKEAQKLL